MSDEFRGGAILFLIAAMLMLLGGAFGASVQSGADEARCAQRLETQERCGKCGDRVVECDGLVCVPGQGWLKRGDK